MLNFDNVNDIDFEYICKDLINAKYHLNLSRGPIGRDSGIDLISNDGDSSIVGQAKFYKKSSFTSLLNSTKKEVGKMLDFVENHDMKYYVYCVANSLTNSNRIKINEQFSSLIEKILDKYHHNLNIVILDLIEISDMLDSDKYKEIMFKHIKLWLPNTNVIKYLNSRENFIDCDLLIEDIKNEKDYYVETDDYYRCLAALERNNCILICGEPGSGKSTLSKMLVLRYLEKGYCVRYSTNADIKTIEEQMNIDDSKEVIFLDDFLGKTSLLLDEDRCLNIINLIKLCKIKNKKIILNTRTKILNTAKKMFYSFKSGIKDKDEEIWIKTENLSTDVKARIFYNHIIGNKVPAKYVSQIRDMKRFLTIIQHRNYSPRIINHVCKFNEDTKNGDFYAFIIDNLDKPLVLWEDEFNKLNKCEKELLYIAYSLNSYRDIPASLLKKCYEYSLNNQSYLEFYNGFDDVLIKMSKSFLNIYNNYYNHDRMVRFLNPSVDDFLKTYLDSNSFQVDKIKENISTFLQARIMYDNDWINKVDCNKMVDFFDDDKTIYIIYVVIKRNLLDEKYLSFFKESFKVEGEPVNWWITRENIWELSLNSEDIYRFYYLDYFKGNEISYINHLYGSNWFDKIIIYSKLLKKMYSKEEYDNYILSLSSNLDNLTSRYVDGNYKEFYTSNDLIACANSYDECSCDDNDIDFEELKNIINRNALKYFKDILISVGIPKKYIDCLSVAIGADIEKDYFEAKADYYAEQAAEAAREEMYEQQHDYDTYDFVADICDKLSEW